MRSTLLVVSRIAMLVAATGINIVVEPASHIESTENTQTGSQSRPQHQTGSYAQTQAGSRLEVGQGNGLSDLPHDNGGALHANSQGGINGANGDLAVTHEQKTPAVTNAQGKSVRVNVLSGADRAGNEHEQGKGLAGAGQTDAPVPTGDAEGNAPADPQVLNQGQGVKHYTAADITGWDYVSPFDLGGIMSYTIMDHNKADPKPEPLTTIISANSWFGHFQGDYEHVFTQNNGLSQYLSALNLSRECLRMGFSKDAFARVNSPHPELRNFLYRDGLEELKDGRCGPTVGGGLRVRGWRQGLSGAFFLGPVLSQDSSKNHDPAANGYNAGRDELVKRAKIGGTDVLGCVWPPAKVHNVENLLQPDAGGPAGLWNHDLPIDGVVSVITIGAPLCSKAKSDKHTSEYRETTTGQQQEHKGSSGLSTPQPSGDDNGANGANGGTTGGKVPASTGASMPSAALTVGSLFAGFLIAVWAL